MYSKPTMVGQRYSHDSTPSVPKKSVLSRSIHAKLLSTPSSTESSKSKKSPNGAINREFTPLLRTVGKQSHDISNSFDIKPKTQALFFDQYQDSISLESMNNSKLYSTRKRNPIESALKNENKDFVGSSMPLKEQENEIDRLQNENFGLRLRVDYYENHTPEQLALDNANLLQENQVLVQELKLLRDKLDQINKEKLINNSLSDTPSKLLLKNQEISELNDTIEELKEELATLKETIDDKDNRIDELEKERLDLQDEINSKEQEKSQSRDDDGDNEEVENLRNHVEELEYENRQLQNDKDSLQDSNEELIENKRSLDKKNIQLQDQVESLEDDIERLRRQLQQGENDVNNNNQLLENDLDTLRKRTRELESSISNLQQMNNQLQSDIKHKNNELETAYKENNSAQQDIINLTNRINLLNELLQQQKTEKSIANEENTNSNENLKFELNSKSSLITKLENECQELRTELLDIKHNYSSIRDELKSTEILMNRTREDAESYKKDSKYYQDKLSEAQIIIRKLNQQANESIMDKTFNEDMNEIKNDMKRKEQDFISKSNQWEQEKRYYEEKIDQIEKINMKYEEQQKNLVKDKSNIQEVISIEKSKHEQSIKSLQFEINQLKTTKTNLETDLQRLQQKEQQYIKQLQEKEDDIIASQSELIAMEDSRDEILHKLNQLQVEHNTLENTLDALRKVVDNHQTDKIKCESKLRENEQQLINLTRENENLSASKESLENKHQILEIKHDKLKLRFTEINDLYNKIKLDKYDISESFIQQQQQQQQKQQQDKLITKYIQKCKDYSKEIKLLHTNEHAITIQLEKYKKYTTKLQEKLSTPQLQHQQELKGMLIQMKYLKQVAIRESKYRSDLEFMKRFFMLQIASYQACNRADLAILQTMGIYPDYETTKGRPKFRSVAFVVIAAIRIRKRYEETDDEIQKKAKLIDIRREWKKNRS